MDPRLESRLAATIETVNANNRDRIKKNPAILTGGLVGESTDPEQK